MSVTRVRRDRTVLDLQSRDERGSTVPTGSQEDISGGCAL